MDTMAQNMKLLTNMAGGKMDFSAGDAEAAKAEVLAASKKIPDLFKGHDMDPASDALPVIWTQWDDFTKTANAARMVVELIDTDTQDQLKASLGQVAQAFGRDVPGRGRSGQVAAVDDLEALARQGHALLPLLVGGGRAAQRNAADRAGPVRAGRGMFC